MASKAEYEKQKGESLLVSLFCRKNMTYSAPKESAKS